MNQAIGQFCAPHPGENLFFEGFRYTLCGFQIIAGGIAAMVILVGLLLLVIRIAQVIARR